MVKKYLCASLSILTAGVILGALLVSSFGNGVDLGMAWSGGDVKLGGPVPVVSQNPSVKALSDNFAVISKAVTPSVVAIEVTTSGKGHDQRMPRDFFHFFGPDFKMLEQEQPSTGFGSGVILTADGYIATNNHVVEDAKEGGIEVVLHDQVRVKAKLIGTDPSTDLAVIKIDMKDLTAAALGNSENVHVLTRQPCSPSATSRCFPLVPRILRVVPRAGRGRTGARWTGPAAAGVPDDRIRRTSVR